MIGEIDIYGVYVPALLLMLLIAFLVTTSIRRGLMRLQFYRFVWHQFLFNFSLFVVVLGCLVLLTRGWQL
ncbi:DUF1656 domain-containing protein [Pseudomonas aeruginosa]|nr:DUF1656 domain-containing protein [Pseudomonas aeruginosa]